MKQLGARKSPKSNLDQDFEAQILYLEGIQKTRSGNDSILISQEESHDPSYQPSIRGLGTLQNSDLQTNDLSVKSSVAIVS